MFSLIPIALFALAGYSSVSNAAPTTPVTQISSVESVHNIPVYWKRHHQHTGGSHADNDIIDEAISKAITDQSIQLMKRQSDNSTEAAPAPEINLNTLFRTIFDNVINHIIEVTPLNDIVHGNYDLLYELFLNKVTEIISNIGKPVDETTNPGQPQLISGSEEASEETGKEEYDGKNDIDQVEESNDNEDNEDDEDNEGSEENEEGWREKKHKKWDQKNYDNEE